MGLNRSTGINKWLGVGDSEVLAWLLEVKQAYVSKAMSSCVQTAFLLCFGFG